jgi:hypothetical protein
MKLIFTEVVDYIDHNGGEYKRICSTTHPGILWQKWGQDGIYADYFEVSDAGLYAELEETWKQLLASN